MSTARIKINRLKLIELLQQKLDDNEKNEAKNNLQAKAHKEALKKLAKKVMSGKNAGDYDASIVWGGARVDIQIPVVNLTPELKEEVALLNKLPTQQLPTLYDGQVRDIRKAINLLSICEDEYVSQSMVKNVADYL